MGLSYNVYLNSDKIFGCKSCKTHLASHDAIISRVCLRPLPSRHLPKTPLLPPKSPHKPPVPFAYFKDCCCKVVRFSSTVLTPSSSWQNFRGQHGKAYLFNTVVNTTQSEAVERNMTTGRHQVRDVICKQCKETVGWKYDKAYEASEKYKEGKFILEAELLCSVS